MCDALVRHGSEYTIMQWMKATLEGRVAVATLNETSLRFMISRGCTQGGVLSPLLWCLVVNDLITRLSGCGVFIQGYADDICLLAVGKFPNTVSGLMQWALSTVEIWCNEVGLSVNPDKTGLVAFTRKKKLQGFFEPQLFGVKLCLSRSVKYLGVILDSWLTWRQHLEVKVRKAQNLLCACKRACGIGWGLRPKVVHWLYVAIVRLTISFASLAWWLGCQMASIKSNLSKVQRLACLGITGAFQTTPTSAMEVLVGLPPLDLVIQGEARAAAHHLWSLGCWSYLHPQQGHSRILTRLQGSDPIFNMRVDFMRPVYNLEPKYRVTMLTREEWTRGPGTPPAVKGLVWFTDRSRTAEGIGAGFYGLSVNRKLSIPLGKHVTVFQAEVYAILACAHEMEAQDWPEKYVSICSDSQVALKALQDAKTSPLVCQCQQALNDISAQHAVKLYWVPGHARVRENEIADRLARSGSGKWFIGPEPCFGVSRQNIRKKMKRWMKNQHLALWRGPYSAQRQAREFISGPDLATGARLLSFNTTQTRAVIGLLTGHNTLRRHLHVMWLNDNPTCRKCGTEEETSVHILCECKALASLRHTYLGSFFLDPEDIRVLGMGAIWNFVKGIGLL